MSHSLLLFALIAAVASPADVRHTTVPRITERIKVDGILDEDTWRAIEPIGEFVQALPYPGKPPTEQTEVRLAYDKDALYIAVRCLGSPRGTLLSTTMARDGNTYTDDNIEVVIDPFHDRRNGYYFMVNPAGAMTDGLIVGNRLTGVSWDGIWDAATRIDEDEWTLEVEIPFKTLSFDPHNTTWGFNIERTITRVTEESRWAGSTLDSLIHAVSRAGDIEGLEGLSQGIGLDVKPYGLFGVNRDVLRQDEVTSVRDVGVDVFYRVTSNLLSSTTVNTDFAETEVDTRQVNLTRFSLLYPEKRAFFLENAGVFQFGFPGTNSTLLPFHSRTIGLVGGNTVPILFGEKLTGQVGRLEMGLLDVATRGSDTAPAQNFLVGRAKLDFWRESYVGGIFTQGEPTGKGDNSLAGADVVLSTSNFLRRRKNFDVAAFGLKTNTTGIQNGDYAYGAQVRYPNDRVNLAYSWQDIGEHFDPRLGYVRRRGVRINSLTTGVAPRPHNRYVRQVSVNVAVEHYYNTTHNAVESRTIAFTPLGISFHSGAKLSYTVSHDVEQLFTPFKIHAGIVIPVDRYAFFRQTSTYQGPTNRRLSYKVSYDSGGFYTGSSDQLDASLSWRQSAHLTTGLEFRQYWVRLAEGDFSTSLAILRFNYFFSSKIALTNFIQYDTDTRNMGLQSRLRWIISPGREIYLVFNHEWQENPFDRFEALRSDVRAKVNYTVRF
jgi:hypothetical protein